MHFYSNTRTNKVHHLFSNFLSRPTITRSHRPPLAVSPGGSPLEVCLWRAAPVGMSMLGCSGICPRRAAQSVLRQQLFLTTNRALPEI